VNKKKLKKVILDRYLDFQFIIENHRELYGSPPSWKGISPLVNHTRDLFDKLPGNKDNKRIKCNIGKNGNHYIHFLHELILYSQKTMNNGKYYSNLFLKSFGLHYSHTRSLIGLSHALRKHINARIDTLLVFTITRSRLEELILNLYFLYKSKNLIKEKKWDELYKLIFKINFSGYENDINLKFRKGRRNIKLFLDYLLKKNNKLHISELTKYVVKQRDLIDDFRPSFGNKINNKITKKDKLLIKKFKLHNDKNEKYDHYSMKPISKLYDMLSLELHPNNLFLRNVITTISDGVELALITRNHMSKILECDDYICDLNQVLYFQNIKLIHLFLDKTNKEKIDLEFINGFNNSVENRLMKNCKYSFQLR